MPFQIELAGEAVPTLVTREHCFPRMNQLMSGKMVIGFKRFVASNKSTFKRSVVSVVDEVTLHIFRG